MSAAEPTNPPASADQPPMFWVRLRSDGGYEGPIHADSIELARVQSGAWSPLYLGVPPKLEAPAKVGGGVFGKGVPSSYVIRAAQRLYVHDEAKAKLTPEQRVDEERRRRGLWDMLNGPLDAAPGQQEQDYEAVLADHSRLVRELDVLLNGEAGAAPQASLCDLVAQVRAKQAQPTEIDLRMLLCITYAGGAAYTDDGEAQDSRALPVIDFLRDSPAEIQQKMQQRSIKQAQAEAVPQGYALVPVEPTPEMEMAWDDANGDGAPFHAMYATLLAAAPQQKGGGHVG